MFLNLLLLFCFVLCIETTPVGTTPTPVTGEKGENITLSCDFEAKDIFKLNLIRFSKPILDCQNETCKSDNDRFFKNGACDVVIKDLGLSDAGKYILKVHYNSTETVLPSKLKTYYIQIHEIVKIGGKLFDELLPNACTVEHQSKFSTEWKEVWRKGDGVQSDDILKNCTATDTGTYRVLDSNNKTLITVSVTESSPESKENLDTEDNKHNEQHKPLTIGLSVCGALLALAGIIFAFYKKCQHRNTDHDDNHQGVPMQDI